MRRSYVSIWVMVLTRHSFMIKPQQIYFEPQIEGISCFCGRVTFLTEGQSWTSWCVMKKLSHIQNFISAMPMARKTSPVADPREGAPAHPPPTDQNFMKFFGTFSKKYMLMPPDGELAPNPTEILDPPMITLKHSSWHQHSSNDTGRARLIRTRLIQSST